MNKPLRVLLIEDSPDDAFFIQQELRRGGFEPVSQRVDTEPDFTAALAAQTWDVVIADYSLPQFDAIVALRLLQKSGLDLPFIIVSGNIGEEVAVAAMKSGAHDYLLKDNLVRLVAAVERELRDARDRWERRRVEETCARLAAIVESSGDAIIGQTLKGAITSWNPGAERIFGHTAREAIGQSILMIQPPDRLEEEKALMERLTRGETIEQFETVRMRKDGKRIDVSVTISLIRNDRGDLVGASKIARDVTERKRAETRVAAFSKLGQNLSTASTPADAASIIGNIADDLFGWDAFTLSLYSPEQDTIRTILNVDTIDGERKSTPGMYENGKPTRVACRVIEQGAELILRDDSHSFAEAVPFGDKARRSASLMFAPLRNHHRVLGILSVQSYAPRAYDQRDLDVLQSLADYCGGALERIRAREELLASEERYRRLSDSAPIGIFECDEQGHVTYVNGRWRQMSGLSEAESKGSGWLRAVHPEERERAEHEWRDALAAESEWNVVHRLQSPDGVVRWVRAKAAVVRSTDGRHVGYVGTIEDISQSKLAEHELRESREQLRVFAAHLQSVGEEERKRVTREIHDELGQSLTGFKMDLAWMRKRLQQDDPGVIREPLIQKMNMMGGLLDETANLVRRLCTELRPGVLDDLGLAAAIEWQAREYQTRTGIRVDVRVELGDLTVDPEHSTALFRIFQEILTNVSRHAQATRVDALLRRLEGQLILAVQDNGRGIEDNQRAGKKSLGLLGMRERAIILGGEVEISGKPGAGTRVRVTVPLQEKPAEPHRTFAAEKSMMVGSPNPS